MQQQIDEPISAILTLNTIAHTVGAAMGGGLALQQFGETWIAVFSAGLTLTILLFSEIIPKTLGATYWKSLAPPTAYVLRSLIWIMKPVLLPLSIFSRFLRMGRAAESTVSRAELEVLAEIGRREGTLDGGGVAHSHEYHESGQGRCGRGDDSPYRRGSRAVRGFRGRGKGSDVG